LSGLAGLIKLVSSLEKRIITFSNLQPAQDDCLEWKMFLLDRLVTYTYQIDPDLMILGVLKMLRYTIDKGLTSEYHVSVYQI
jgi:collagenase-like PrtC family protease